MRYKTDSAAMVYLLRQKNGQTQVLLQQRGGVIFGAGLWEASAAGHVDEGESMTACAIRETNEEIGVGFDKLDIVFTSIIHANLGDPYTPYYNGHFFVDKFRGEPKICECDKCNCLKWFDIKSLPPNMFSDRREAIQNFLDKKSYSEVGWKKL